MSDEQIFLDLNSCQCDKQCLIDPDLTQKYFISVLKDNLNINAYSVSCLVQVGGYKCTIIFSDSVIYIKTIANEKKARCQVDYENIMKAKDLFKYIKEFYMPTRIQILKGECND